ncbi:MAG: RraA family protein, partial [Dehalococcoidia bacterium]|nr:RraA family protein [Dehalococcoidia bacterium]
EQIESIGAPRATYVGSFVRGFGVMDYRIQPLRPDWKMIGPAVTVQLSEPDAGIPMLAMDLMQEGDVLVVAAGGQMETLCFGGGMASTGLQKKFAGAVIDGAVSDYEHLLSRGFPVFARGTVACHDVRYIPGSINVPVVCGGCIVNPGDLIVGSGDGVCVIPKDKIAWVAEELEAQRKRLAEYSRILREGGTIGDGVNAKQRFSGPEFIWE